MTEFLKRAATIAGGIIGLVVAIFLIAFLLHFSELLAALLLVLLCIGTLAGCVRLAAWAWWAWHGPRVYYEREEKPARVVASRDGAWVALEKPVLPPGLQTLTYSYEPRGLPAPASSVSVPPEAMPVTVRPVPSTRTLIEQGALGRGQDILLGFDAEGNAIYRAWKQLKAILILGLQGGGKTTTACWMLAQVVLSGGRLAVIDKHARSEEDSLYAKLRPLEACLVCPVGDAPNTALQVLGVACAIFEARLAGEPCSFPLLLVVDEFSAILRQGESGGPWETVARELVALVEDLNFEGRKHQCYAICIGQATNASRNGGTEVRDTFNTRIVHAMREKQAQMLGLTEQQQQIARLERGQVYVDSEGAGEPFFVQIPSLSEADLRLIAAYLRLPSPQANPTMPTLPPLPYKPGRTPLPVTGDASALSSSLSPVAPLKRVPKALTPEERERERILAAHQENPDLSASALASLLHISNNKVALIKRIITEAQQVTNHASAEASPSEKGAI
ncbi:MAG TPA: hypothetical protein VH599_01625 [Ktedonobacterales bacterium]|jgi:hypothetical protein